MKISKSVTKAVDIAAPVSKTFRFLSDPLNWPKYAVINLTSVKQGADGWYQMEARMGSGEGSTVMMTFFQPDSMKEDV